MSYNFPIYNWTAAGDGNYYSAVQSGSITPTGGVTFSGTETENETLTAANTIATAAGINTISYQWYRDVSTVITGATNAAYVLATADVTHTVFCRGTLLDNMGNTFTFDSADSGVIAVASGLTYFQTMDFEDGTAGASANGGDAFGEPYSLTKYTTAQAAVGTQSAQFECPVGAEGFGIWGGVIPFATTATGWLVNNVAGYNSGDTSIALDSGTGSIQAYAYIQFSGDSNIYRVNNTFTSGNLTLSGTGLKQSLADNATVTLTNSDITYGETLIFEYESYVPSTVDFLAEPGWVKTLRFTTPSGNVEFAEKPDGSFGLFSEVDPGDPGTFSATGVRTKGVWQKMRFEAYFHETAGTMELFVDDVSVVSVGSTKTMAIGDTCYQVLMGTNWNNGAPMILTSVSGGTPAVDDIISQTAGSGTAGSNFASIAADYGSNKYAITSVAPVTSITRSGSTATVVTSTAHGIGNGALGKIIGADQSEYNLRTAMTYISATSFSYTVSGTPTTPATGTIYAADVFRSSSLGLADADTISNGTWTATLPAGSAIYYVDEIKMRRT